jgi:hypothetical protein
VVKPEVTASQTLHILELLRTYRGGITPMDALREAGCMRLAARISDLRAAGYVIETEMVTVAGRRFARYHLKEIR